MPDALPSSSAVQREPHVAHSTRCVVFCLTPSSSLVSQPGAIFSEFESRFLHTHWFQFRSLLTSTVPTHTTHVRPLNATCVLLPSPAQSCWSWSTPTLLRLQHCFRPQLSNADHTRSPTQRNVRGLAQPSSVLLITVYKTFLISTWISNSGFGLHPSNSPKFVSMKFGSLFLSLNI